MSLIHMVKTPEEIQAMREGGVLLASVLAQVSAHVAPGVTTADLDKLAQDLIVGHGAKPSFLNYQPHGAKTPYPAALCTSVNDEVVHGIPSERILREGDIIGLDLGLWYKGVCVGKDEIMRLKTEAQKLIDVTRKSLYAGIAAVKAGAHLGDIGSAIQTYIEKNKFGVVRDLAGHGVGHAVHEDPMILNFGRKGTGQVLEENMTIALEPMVTDGDWHVTIDEDGWTIRTADRKFSAHFEHTLVVTKDGCEILTELVR